MWPPHPNLQTSSILNRLVIAMSEKTRCVHYCSVLTPIAFYIKNCVHDKDDIFPGVSPDTCTTQFIKLDLYLRRNSRFIYQFNVLHAYIKYSRKDLVKLYTKAQIVSNLQIRENFCLALLYIRGLGKMIGHLYKYNYFYFPYSDIRNIICLILLHGIIQDV